MKDKIYLTDVKIEGFKSYGDLKGNEIHLNKDINIIIGANGVGKSNFISFLEMIAYITSGGFEDYLAKNGFAKSILHFGPSHTQKLTGRLKFEAGNKKDAYSFVLAPSVGGILYFVNERIYYERLDKDTPYEKEFGVSVSGSQLITNAQNDSTVRGVVSLLKSCKVFHFNDTSVNSGMRTQSYVNNNKYLMSDAGNIAAFLFKMSQDNVEYYSRIVRVIREIFPRFDNFVLTPTDYENADNYILLNWKEKGSNEVFGPYMLSDGTLRCIALVSLLLQPEETMPSVIILDEPEMGLHPYAINLIADLIKKVSAQVQIIVTTQSVTLLNCFDSNQVLVAEYDNERQSSYIKKLDEDSLRIWLSEYSLGELWEKNVLGGVPL